MMQGRPDSNASEACNATYYVEGEEFMSEKYQLRINNLKNYAPSTIQMLHNTLTQTLQLVPRKITSSVGLAPRSNNELVKPGVHVHFGSEEHRQKALKAINEYKWPPHWKNISAELIDPCNDLLLRKHYKKRLKQLLLDRPPDSCFDKSQAPVGSSEEEKSFPNFLDLPVTSQVEAVKLSIVPLYTLPYEKQLLEKEEEARDILQNIRIQLSEANPDLAKHFDKEAKNFNGMPCAFQGFISNPNNLKGYRKKFTFAFGKDEKNQPIIGFLAKGTNFVAPIPTDLVNMPQEILDSVLHFENCVRRIPWEIYDPETNTGTWETLTVHLGSAPDQKMLIANVHNLHKKEKKLRKVDIVNYYQARPAPCMPTTIYLMAHEPWKVKQHPFCVLGDGKILDKACELTLQVSKRAFFRENVELVVKAVRDVSELNKSLTLLELGCGIGTISLALAKDVHYVYGVDNSETSVKDASKIVELNNITNATFFWGPEQPEFAFLRQKPAGDILAVIDASRSGLQPKQIEFLRNLERLKKLVFLTCNQTALSLIEAFATLFCPPSNTLRTSPFVPRNLKLPAALLNLNVRMMTQGRRIPNDSKQNSH